MIELLHETETKDKAAGIFISLTDFQIGDRNGDKELTLDDLTVNESLFQIEANWEASVDIDKQCFK